MILYTTSLDGLTPERLGGGFFVGWPNPPTPATHLRILQRSAHVVLAVDEEAPGAPVVGFINALSDGVLAATIPLLEVLPACQGRGIGSALVRRMIEVLQPIYMIDLLCDRTLVPFYQRLGMQAVSGMVIRNYATQAGLPPGEDSQ